MKKSVQNSNYMKDLCSVFHKIQQITNCPELYRIESTHKNRVFICVVKGIITLYNGANAMQMNAGTVCMIQPDGSTGIRKDGNGEVMVYCIFCESKTPEVQKNPCIIAPRDFYLHEALLHQLNMVTDRISYDCSNEKLVLFKQWLDNIIFDNTAKYLPQNNHSDNSYLMYSIQEAARYIEKNYSEPLKRSAIAAKWGFHPDYFSMYFHRHTGYTLMEFIHNRRLQVASSLLKNTDLPISQIADRVGYEDFHYFSRLYKKRMGIPPREERRLENRVSSA